MTRMTAKAGCQVQRLPECTGAGLRGWTPLQNRVRAATTLVSSESTSVSVSRDTKETSAYPRRLTVETIESCECEASRWLGIDAVAPGPMAPIPALRETQLVIKPTMPRDDCRGNRKHQLDWHTPIL